MDTTKRRATVSTFEELATRPFEPGHNALCWPRTLAGDFGEVARRLAPPEGLRVITAGDLHTLTLSPAGRIAADLMLEDLRRLDALGHEPVLNCITSYPRDERGLAISTDVMSFHVDRSPIHVDTWLCTYHGQPSEGLDNDEAQRRIDAAEVRATLRSQFDNQFPDDGFEDFDEFVREGAFDLHYRANEDAEPFSFGVGNLWRIAVLWPGSPVPPCIHRAPLAGPGYEPRLLLIC